jgi:N utilization substance protein B
MLNRRHLRVKVLQSLYAYFQANELEYKNVEKDLLNSIERIYDLYLYLLLSFEEVVEVCSIKIEENKTKPRPTKSDLEPNTRFIDNPVFKTIIESSDLREASEKNKVNWVGVEHREMFKKIVNTIKESEEYFVYMNNETSTFEEDREFAVSLFKKYIANSELIYNFFEEKSINWLDDIDLACSMVLKSIKGIEAEKTFHVMPLYKDKEDEITFVKMLLQKTIALDKENLTLIDELTKNWELDRIAKMDILLLKMAITELQIFNNIPKKVTLNEYIEISKFYSTPKSSGFINGILDKAIVILESNSKIQKIGRGLIN